MAKINVRVSRNDFPQIAKAIPTATDEVINKRRGPEMERIAKERSRVDTGRMRDAWKWERTAVGKGSLTNDVEYVVYNEYGTRNMAAQPMARPAALEVFPKIERDLRNIEKFIK